MNVDREQPLDNVIAAVAVRAIKALHVPTRGRWLRVDWCCSTIKPARRGT